MKAIHLMLILGLGLAGNCAAAAPQKATEPPFYGLDYVMGAANAKVTVVEYGSATCSHCARFAAQIAPLIKRKYVDTGRVKFVFREFLTEPTETAASAFIVARCAGKSNYYKVLEEFFRSQPEMASGKPGSEPVTVLMRIAKSYGIDSERFHTCLADPKAVKTLGDRLGYAINIDNVDGTPTILVNGRKIDPGLNEWSMDVIGPAIDQALKAVH